MSTLLKIALTCGSLSMTAGMFYAIGFMSGIISIKDVNMGLFVALWMGPLTVGWIMTKQLEQRRAAAKTQSDGYLATIDSIEPHVAPIDAPASYASAAVSLKRIADVHELFATSLITDYKQKETDMRDWAHRHGFGDLWDKAAS